MPLFGPSQTASSFDEEHQNELAKIFQQQNDSAKSAGKKNIWLGILQSAMTDDPSHIFNAVSSQGQIDAKAAQAKQLLSTPDFKSIDPQFQKLAAGFAGSGDASHAMEMINAGRTQAKRAQDDRDQAKISEATQRMLQSGDPNEFIQVLAPIHPQAAATAYQSLGTKARSETIQSLGQKSQALKEEQSALKGDKSTEPLRNMDAMFTKLKSLNLTPEQYALNSKELVQKGILKPEDAKNFDRIKEQMSTQGLSLEQPNPLVNEARKAITTSAPGVAKFLGINPPQQQVPPDQYLRQAFEKSVAPEALQQYQGQKARGQEISQELQNLKEQQANTKFVTKPRKSGNQQVLEKQSSGFPKTLSDGKHTATVSNAQEEQEARKEGFR